MTDTPPPHGDGAAPKRVCAARALPWFALSIMAAALIMALLSFGVTVDVPSFGPVEPPRPQIIVDVSASGGMGKGLIAEQASLFDSGPLFLPTHWNAGRARAFYEFASERLPTPFLPYDLVIAPDAATVAAFAPAYRAGTIRPEDLLDARYSDFFAQVRRVDVLEAQPSSIGRVQIIANGRVVRTLSGDEAMPALLRERLWAPMDFLILVDDGGQILGTPLPVGSTGEEPIDKALLQWASGRLSGVALPPGHFRVRVLP